MSKHIAGPEIERLIQLLARIPGLGPRSARRAALYLIKKRETLLEPLNRAMQDAVENIRVCSICANIDTSNPCTICNDKHRDPSTLIVVEDVSDIWALERASVMQAYYHVLGGRLSPLDGIGPDDLNLKTLRNRVTNGKMQEIILAVNATVEGQTTAYYIADMLASFNLKITRLAHGIPIGGELDYLDEGTLAAALQARA
ncbi:MAG: recombination protein RecR [Candidatus Tokpelaia sp. JSC085]|nr:MAG: recombination protein RecR [Candidatus Tokpelaia sp. JSC085]